MILCQVCDCCALPIQRIREMIDDLVILLLVAHHYFLHYAVFEQDCSYNLLLYLFYIYNLNEKVPGFEIKKTCLEAHRQMIDPI